MIYFYLALAMSLGACAGYVIGGMFGRDAGYRDGWNAAYRGSTDEDPHIGIGA